MLYTLWSTDGIRVLKYYIIYLYHIVICLLNTRDLEKASDIHCQVIQQRVVSSSHFTKSWRTSCIWHIYKIDQTEGILNLQ